MNMNPVRNFLIPDRKNNISNGANSKGIALILVLSFTLIVAILANITLIVIRSQSRLTHHQLSRIQAIYAAQAGMNYALEKLRVGDSNWTSTNCTAASPCSVPFDSGDFKPPSIVGNTVSVVIRAPGSSGCLGNEACISTTATYTYED